MELPKFKDYKDQPVRYISPKMDGHMYYIRVDRCGKITCMTKNGKDRTEKILNCPHLMFKLINLPCDTGLMAEFHCPGIPATSVPTMINDGDERLQISVFAAPMLGGEDLRGTDLPVVMNRVMMHGLDTVPVESIKHKYEQEFVQDLLDKAITGKIEGWVLKESHMEGWYKLKPVKTIDAIIVDHQVSDSKSYTGCLKSVSLGLVNNDGTIHDLGECGGGFSKKFKLSLNTVNLRNNLIDKVIEVAYQSITPGKKLQFPRFIRFRDDKDPDQCTVDQIGFNGRRVR
jgi:ATP-dependent DNA ligase